MLSIDTINQSSLEFNSFNTFWIMSGEDGGDDEPKYKVFDALNRVRPPTLILDLHQKKFVMLSKHHL